MANLSKTTLSQKSPLQSTVMYWMMWFQVSLGVRLPAMGAGPPPPLTSASSLSPHPGGLCGNKPHEVKCPAQHPGRWAIFTQGSGPRPA